MAPTHPIPSEAERLDDCLATSFRLLATGVTDRHSSFRTPVLGTTGPDGAPTLRTVVLRGFSAPERLLRIHTDIRSAKIEHIAVQRCVAVHAYDPGEQIQLRLSGYATVHTQDAIADQDWDEAPLQSRLCYAVTPGPGTPVPEPPLAPLSPDGARAHFAAVLIEFNCLEFLLLASAGHRRARFTWDAAGMQATWLVP